ncbi:unnamed protein product [Pylaiella littoralis]
MPHHENGWRATKLPSNYFRSRTRRLTPLTNASWRSWPRTLLKTGRFRGKLHLTSFTSWPDYGDQDFPDHLTFHSARPALITPQSQNRACMAIIALGPGLQLPLDRAGEFDSSELFDDDDDDVKLDTLKKALQHPNAVLSMTVYDHLTFKDAADKGSSLHYAEEMSRVRIIFC